jgi:hypothetical protein
MGRWGDGEMGGWGWEERMSSVICDRYVQHVFDG